MSSGLKYKGITLIDKIKDRINLSHRSYKYIYQDLFLKLLCKSIFVCEQANIVKIIKDYSPYGMASERPGK